MKPMGAFADYCILATCAMLFVLSGTASAQPGKSQADRIAAGVDEVFAKDDTNGDGRISRAEFAAALRRENPDVPQEAIDQSLPSLFDPVDTNKDGYITKVELAIYNARYLTGDCEGCQ